MKCSVAGCPEKFVYNIFGKLNLCDAHSAIWHASQEYVRARYQAADFLRRVEAEERNAVRRGKDASAGD